MASSAGLDLVETAPWLLQRLPLELQGSGIDWRQAIGELDAEVVTGLARALQAVKSAAGDAAAPHESGPGYRARLERLLDVGRPAQVGAEGSAPAAPAGGDVRATADDSFADESGTLRQLAAMPAGRREKMLRDAEMLTLAAAELLALPMAQLQDFKQRYLPAYLQDSGYHYDASSFIDQYAVQLRQQGLLQPRADLRNRLQARLQRERRPLVTALLARMLAALDAGAGVTSPAASGPARDEVEVDEEIYLDNAGLVLVAPFLPRLFEKMGLVESGEFVSADAAERAVHCLQFLVDEDLASPEYRLVLNKLLCGVRPGRPIVGAIEIDAAERAQLGDLLRAVCAHWKPLANTSIDGLRESFLQREGRLERSPFRLRLGRTPFDGRLSLDLRGKIPVAALDLRSADVDIGALLSDLEIINQDSTTLTLTLSNASQHLPVIFKAITGAGGHVSETSLRSPHLETLFLLLTGKELRE